MIHLVQVITLYLYKFKLVQYNKIMNLLYNADIIINPSFFEGWSTVVEEAKILDKKILLSNIDVHIEQNPKKGIYFDPYNPKDLANSIQKIYESRKGVRKNLKTLINNYHNNRKLFAERFIEIVQTLKI